MDFAEIAETVGETSQPASLPVLKSLQFKLSDGSHVHKLKSACLMNHFLWNGSPIGDNPPHSFSSLALGWQALLQKDPCCCSTGARDSDLPAGNHMATATYL